MRLRYFLLCFLLLLATGLTAQQSQSWYLNKPITEIQFDGLQHVSQSDLDPIIEPFIGKEFNDSLFMDLQSKLYALNYFSLIEAEAVPESDAREALILLFRVNERPIVDRIEFSGNRNIRDAEILDAILLKRDDILTKNKLNVDEGAIRGLYQEKGFSNINVSSETETDEENNTVRVVFIIDEGFQTRIREIRFSGNSFAPESTLRKQLVSKEQTFFNSGIFKQNQLEQDKANIERYYHEQGYIDARVADIGQEVVESEKNKNFLNITFFIEEGRQWTFGGIEFEGNQLFDDEELLGKFSLAEGDILNLTKLQQSFTRISDLYYNDGYIYNSISQKESRNDEDKSISFFIQIIEKGRAHIENIIVKGNVKTKDKVVFREIPLETGDIFSKKQVITGMQNLYNTGLFSNVVPETPFGSAEGLMDLVINVEEAKTTNINFGITFTGQAGQFPMIGFLKWTDNNFRGQGEQLSVGTELSGTQQNLNLSYQTNWLMDRRWSGGVNLTVEHLNNSGVQQDILDERFTEEQYDNDEAAPDPYNSYDEYQEALEEGESIDEAYLMEYDQWELSLGLSTGYTWITDIGRVGASTGLSSGLSYIDYDDLAYRPYNPSIRNNLDQWRFNNRWWSRLSLDRRDYIFAPSKGFYLGQTFTYGGGLLGGVSHYLKTQSTGKLFFTLVDYPLFKNWNLKTVLALHSSLSFILPQFYRDDGNWQTGIEATTSYLLYTDGMNVARGWTRMYDKEALWDNWTELRIPIAEQVLWTDIFFRGTGVWDSRKQFGFITESPENYYFSYGAGLRFTIPNLPLGLYLTKLFKLDSDGNIEPQAGPIFSDPDDPDSGMILVLTINIDFM